MERPSSIICQGSRTGKIQPKSSDGRLLMLYSTSLPRRGFTNPVWGTGLHLDDADVLDRSKWIKSGNLLGKTLMQIRKEIVTIRGQPDN